MKYALLFFIMIYAKNCGSQKSTVDRLDGVWKITAIENTEITNNDDIKCTININNSTIVMTVGCNNHTGKFKIINNKIHVIDVFATEMYCQTLNALEKKLNSNLPTISDYKLKNEKLVFLNPKGDIVFNLVKK